MRLYSCQLGLLFASVLGIPANAAEHKIRVLIVDGFSNHDWKQTTVLLRGILAAAGGFEVSVSTAPIDPNSAAWAAWRPRFADYDVVIQTCNEGAMNGLLTGVKPKPDWPDAVKMDFADFVRNGGGVYIFHAAENAFVGWKEYEDMVGLSWRDANYGSSIRVGKNGEMVRIAPGEGGETSHGPRDDRLITRIGYDPIHAGPKRGLLQIEKSTFMRAVRRSGSRCLPMPRTLCRDWACCGLWNGQPLTAKAVFMFRFTAMSGRGMCNRRECAAPLCRPLFRACCNGWLDGK